MFLQMPPAVAKGSWRAPTMMPDHPPGSLYWGVSWSSDGGERLFVLDCGASEGPCMGSVIGGYVLC